MYSRDSFRACSRASASSSRRVRRRGVADMLVFHAASVKHPNNLKSLLGVLRGTSKYKDFSFSFC